MQCSIEKGQKDKNDIQRKLKTLHHISANLIMVIEETHRHDLLNTFMFKIDNSYI